MGVECRVFKSCLYKKTTHELKMIGEFSVKRKGVWESNPGIFKCTEVIHKML